jgi:hypothetical protein
MGEKLMERRFERDLMLDWDLDLDVVRRHTDRAIAHGRKPLKLVHNLIFSMPILIDELVAAQYARRPAQLRSLASHPDDSEPEIGGGTIKQPILVGGLRLCASID